VLAATRPKRRHAQLVHLQPVVEILPESSPCRCSRQIRVRGGDDPDVERRLAPAPEPLHRALLKRAQQLHLQIQRQLANLVEEDRAGVRALERSGLIGDRSRERASRMAEQLVLDQRRRQAGAVDDDEGGVAAWGSAMNGLRHAFLAGARLAEDEHRDERIARDALHVALEGVDVG
jgi:hypothetical protein